MIPVNQTLFGDIKAPVAERGDCFSACVASLLELRLDEVPHFYGVDSPDPDGGPLEGQYINDWLRSRGVLRICWQWEDVTDHMWELLSGALCVVSGISPRFPDSQHAVIGCLDGVGGWRLVHDPHPSGEGIAGDPASFELMARVEFSP